MTNIYASKNHGEVMTCAKQILQEAVRFKFEDGSESVYAFIPTDMLVVEDSDKGYQRKTTATVDKLIREWDNDKLDAIVVSFRDDKFYVIDGGHRLEGAKAKGHKFLLARIITGCKATKEATLFATQNKAKARIQPVDIHKANLFNKEPIAMIMQKVCDKYGVEIRKPVRGPSGHNGLSDLTHSRDIIRKHGEVGFDWMMDVLYQSGWNVFPHGHSTTILLALQNVYKNKIFKQHLDVVTTLLITHLKNTTPKELKKIAIKTFHGLFASGEERHATNAYLELIITNGLNSIGISVHSEYVERAFKENE